MLDTNHILFEDSYSKTFYAADSTWQVWQKPRGAKLVQIFCLAGGGGGGGGSCGSSSALLCGGAGGGGGAHSKGIYPAFLLPDILYIQVGTGGIGGLSLTFGTGVGVNGSPGSASYVSISPSALPLHVIQQSGSGGGGGNGGGNPAGAAPGGAAGTQWSPGSSNAFASMGIITSSPGVLGGDGKSGASGLSVTALAVLGGSTANIVTGGAGGGGRGSNGTFPGGSVLPASLLLLNTLAGGAIGVNALGSPGQNGYGLMSPLCGTGGSGGGASSSTRGGAGGDGFYGCGGGGAGGCVSTATVTVRGGRGGNGLVIINTI